MKIVVVNAFFPPNFVSGGTLQPQRLARGLRSLGHDVRVYTGHLDPALPALHAWDSVDETGLPVRRIVISPFIGWADWRNYDNPAVRDDFARWLDDVRPDVVHAHSIQGLGAGLLAAAQEAGAKVVVSMHDFWWFCARQFLADTTITPCCSVVVAGTCPCESTRGFLEERNRYLARQLEHVDVVLGVSAAASRVFVANGVPPAKLRVDENGLPADVTRSSGEHVPSDQGVRFLYHGGSHPLKGIGVLLEACRSLPRHGWTLDAYGPRDFVRAMGVSLGSMPVRLRPPFDPDDVHEVLARHDVLIVPSVMRESYNLATREALRHGLPVIATDSIGPEEVVAHERNGLLVPSADPAALARAMRRLVDDPALLERLRVGASGSQVRIRPLAEQLDGLDALYRELTTPPAPATRSADAPSVRRVVFMAGIDGACLRYRVRLPVEGLAAQGVAAEARYYWDPDLFALIDASDVLVVYRVPATHQVLELIDHARRQGMPVVFDADDLIFDPAIADEIPALKILSPAEAEGWLHGVHRYRTTMEHCDGYIGSTSTLVDHAHRVTGLPSATFENGVGILLGRASDQALRAARVPGPLRIGYVSGTITHDHDWYYVEPAILEIMRRHPDVELWLGGYLPHTAALEPFAGRIRRLPFVPWYQLPQILANLDVNLAPLEPGSIFNEGKSAIKWLEAALCGTPTVASATASFVDAIDQWRTGVLATDLADWEDALDRLIRDPDLRARMANQGRREALLRWSPHVQGRRYLDVLTEAFTWAQRPPERDAWTDVIADEPFQPRALEPYVAGEPGDVRELLSAADPAGAQSARWTRPASRAIARTRDMVRRLA